MKLFSDLKIGDIVYKVHTGYRAKEGPQLEKIHVFQLGVEKELFQVNKYPGYSNYTYLVNIPLSDAVKFNTIRTADEFITTSEEQVKAGLKEAGMKLIKSYEGSIATYEELILETRKLYFDYLNYK